jgi:hypothetical protein
MIARPGRVLSGAAFVLTLAASAVAQTDPPFVVERPSFSTPPDVVGRGFWQIEAGVAWERDAALDGPSRTTWTLPNGIVRLGVSRRLELRFATTGLVSTRERGTRDTAATDIELGVKYQVASQAGHGVDLSLVPMVSLPTGGAGSSRNADPSVILTANRAMGAAGLNLNVKWSAPSVGDDASSRARVLDWSAVLAFPVRGAWSAFVEGVATDVDTADVPTQWIGNAGLGRQVGANLLLDVYGGVGLNDAAPDWTIGAGLGWRFRR